MSELDPVLAEAREPWGAPRFYPHGKHPATYQWRRQLERLERHRERLDEVRRAYELDHAVSPFYETEEQVLHRKMVEETDAMIAHAKRHLALFEEGESIRKADHIRMVEGRR